VTQEVTHVKVSNNSMLNRRPLARNSNILLKQVIVYVST